MQQSPGSTWEEERDLCREIKAASPEAWARIYDKYAQKVYLYVLGRIRNRQAAEDITSTVFLKALKTISSYNPSRKPLLAWLYGVARHAVTDWLRKSRPTVRLEGAAASATEPLPAVERLDLGAALDKLTGKQREVVVLYYYAGFSVPEIAVLFGKKERAVYSLHARALKALRGHLVTEEAPKNFARVE